MKKYLTQKSFEKFILSISGRPDPLEIAKIQSPITLPGGGIVCHPPTSVFITSSNLIIKDRLNKENSFPLADLSVEWFRINGIRLPL